MNPPEMAGWNLALRFGLEVGALVSLGAAAWSTSSGPMRWIAVVVVPFVAATLWGVFNVLNDPSRSGKAPVEVAGWIRLCIELIILGAGAFAVGYTMGSTVGISYALLVAIHYAASWSRVRWMLAA